LNARNADARAVTLLFGLRAFKTRANGLDRLLNYQFWPRLTAGVGAGFGYVNVDTGSDQTYEQLLARVNWRPTDKLSFQINGRH